MELASFVEKIPDVTHYYGDNNDDTKEEETDAEKDEDYDSDEELVQLDALEESFREAREEFDYATGRQLREKHLYDVILEKCHARIKRQIKQEDYKAAAREIIKKNGVAEIVLNNKRGIPEAIKIKIREILKIEIPEQTTNIDNNRMNRKNKDKIDNDAIDPVTKKKQVFEDI